MTSSRLKLIVLAIIPTFIVLGCGEEQVSEDEGVRPVRAMKVADYAGLTGRSFPGLAKATQEVDLAFRVSGPLIIRINIGDMTAGTLIGGQ